MIEILKKTKTYFRSTQEHGVTVLVIIDQSSEFQLSFT